MYRDFSRSKERKMFDCGCQGLAAHKLNPFFIHFAAADFAHRPALSKELSRQSKELLQ